jgi:hypothetical protein
MEESKRVGKDFFHPSSFHDFCDTKTLPQFTNIKSGWRIYLTKSKYGVIINQQRHPDSSFNNK